MSDKLAELYVEITAKTDKLVAGLNEVKKDTGKMSSAFGTASVAIGNFAAMAAQQILSQLGGAIKSVTIDAANLADEILDVSKVTGLTTKEVQKIKLAADMEGKSFTSVTTMVKFYSAALKDAADATRQGKGAANEAAEAFKYLGIDIDAFNKLTTGQQLDILLPKLAAITNANDRMTIGQKILGRGFIENMDIINTYVSKGGEISKLVDAFAPTQEQLERAATLKESMGTLQYIYDSLAIIMAGPLADAFKQLEPLIIRVATNIGNWLNDPKNIAMLDQLITKLGEFIDKILKAMTTWEGLDPGVKSLIMSTGGAGMGVFLKTQGFASGGIVTQPQLAMVGEAGPEAIIPLSQMGNMGGGVNLNIYGYYGDEMSRRQLMRDLEKIRQEESRRSVTPGTQTSVYSVGGHL